MHISVPVENTVQFINVTEISPLISKCQIKVCYVGENRNKTVISKEVAEKLGKTLPGSPIVGYYNSDNQDFEQHNRELEIKDGKYAIVDTTRPYGFVDINAKVWFQKFIDDGINEREYLVTEGYIWSGVYPESKRIVEHGNNQSMELHKDSVKGHWSGDFNSNERFFIINEAIIEKLCILGENFEPCFEGSQIKTHFSLEEQFAELKNTMFAMMNELKEALNEGGSSISMPDKELELQVEEVVEEPAEIAEEPIAAEVDGEPAEEYKAEEEEKESDSEDNSDKQDSEKNENKVESEEEKKEEYVLEEAAEELKNEEYEVLAQQYAELSVSYAALEESMNQLLVEVESLREFKLSKDREEKQAMINGFYMLSEEDKADVIANIDSYSLDDIEAKLAVICVRNKVNFSLNEEAEEQPVMTFNLSDVEIEDSTPAWVKAVKETASNM